MNVIWACSHEWIHLGFGLNYRVVHWFLVSFAHGKSVRLWMCSSFRHLVTKLFILMFIWVLILVWWVFDAITHLFEVFFVCRIFEVIRNTCFATFFQKCQTFFLHLEHAFDSGLCKNFSDYLSIQLKCVCVFCFILGCLKISLLVNSVITFQWTNGLTISAASRYGRLLLVCRLLTLYDWYLGNFNELKRRSKKACTIVHVHVQKLFDNKQSIKIGQNTTKCFLFKNYHMPGTVG